MPQDTVDYARQNFEHNRLIAEKRLQGIREEARQWLSVRHNKTTMGAVARLLALLFYHLGDKKRMVDAIRETRWRIQLYRKVESSLANGDLSSAIEALSIFAPREETATETVRRVGRNPPTVWAIQRSPHILRVNMLKLRDDLIQIRGTKLC